MAKTDTKAELTKLQSVLNKNNRLRLEFLGQTSALLRQHGVAISDALLSNLTLGAKDDAGDDKGPPKPPPKGAKAVGGPPKPPVLAATVGGPPKPPPMKAPVGGPPKPPPMKPDVGGPPKPPPAAAAAKQAKAKKAAVKPVSKKK